MSELKNYKTHKLVKALQEAHQKGILGCDLAQLLWVGCINQYVAEARKAGYRIYTRQETRRKSEGWGEESCVRYFLAPDESETNETSKSEVVQSEK